MSTRPAERQTVAALPLSGALRPIKWIGRRAYDPRFVAGNRMVLPIRVL